LAQLTLKRSNLGHYYFSPILKKTREDLLPSMTRFAIVIDAGDYEMLDEVAFYGPEVVARSV